ncbi:tetratricopeptide repeat protein (plasmid) [Acaryochloris sp. 'Moss Beach']|uniref:CHAT domain-containing tetratricopeptide repeat protein n=1 Tax=Acaryochloris sp. 'Moss Beach' TaxID=2740837 RepID=UPI001F2A2ED4|nr:CHAT domain-containing tetratricopeptide repeat protein [Acaryochloris sp. 'Moss Beach']UJB73013.1 tetratricopeptide repeat protein [Acaryochloris sp. 'Moss Beach']
MIKVPLKGSVCLLFLSLWGGAVFLPHPVSVAQEIPEQQSPQKARADQLLSQGIEHFNKGQFREAKAAWEEALNLYRQIGDQKGVANSLINLGSAYRSLGEYAQAIDYYQQSLVIFRQIGDQNGVANPLMGLGNVYFSLGEYAQAIDYHQQSLGIMRKNGNQKGAANSLMGLGNAYRFLGEYAQAIDYYQQSLVIFRKNGDQNGVANSLINLGSAYRSLGEYAQAIDYYQQSLVIFRQIGDQNGVAKSLGNLGLAYHSLREYAQAIDYYQQSLVIFQKNGNQNGIANSLGNLGLAYHSLREYAQAIDYHQQSLVIFRKNGNQNGIANSLMNLGLAYDSLGEVVQAIDYHHKSLEIFRKIGDQNGVAKSLWGLGLAHLSQKQYSLSQTHLKDSIEVWEKLHTNLSVPQQISFFETQANSYSDLQTVLVAQSQPLQALVVAEQGRTRALNQQLSGANAPFDLEQIKQVAKEQNATIVEYTLVRNNLLYAWVIHPDGTIDHQPIGGKKLGKSLDNLEAQTRQWLENIRGVKDPNQDNAIPQALDNANLEDDLSPSASQEKTNYTYLRQLHTLLIEPIEDYLPQDPNERVIIIPHRSLFFVPFPALLENKGEKPKYLVDKHIISTAPSIQALKHLQDQENLKPQRPQRPQRPLIIGNPTPPSESFDDLKGAKSEAELIAKTLKTQPVLGDKATESLVRNKLLTADLIHIAAHGEFKPNESLKLLKDLTPAEKAKAEAEAAEAKKKNLPPGGGSIILAKDPNHDGYLQTQELIKMTKENRLQAEMVVLSACKTGLGKVTGDGIVGLSRSLLAAGVPTVVVSLWSVSDHSTTMLMNEFYTNVYAKGWDKAKSLTMAMRTTKKKHTDPGKWAAFTLIGLPE